MNQETVKYNGFRIFISLLAAMLFGIMSFSFYRTISSVTDENSFETAPRIMVAKDIPAYRIDSKTSEKKLDTLFRGDFIATLNDSIALEKKDFFVRLENSLSEKTIKFRVFNFKNLLIKDLYVQASDLELNDFEYQESIVMVSNVAPDGASDRAGMKRWDMIVAIDGKTFKDMFEADRIARIEGKEHPLTYTILRNGEKLDITVNLARYGISFNKFLFLISGMLTIALGFYIGFKRPELRSARLTSMGLVLIGFLISFAIDIYPKNFDHFSELMMAIYHISFFIGIPVFLHSTFHFPDENKAYTSKPWFVWTMYIIGILGLVSSVIWYYVLQEGLLYIYFGMGYILLILLYVFLVKIFNRDKTSKEDVRRGKAIRWALNSSLAIVLLISVFFVTDLRVFLPSNSIFTQIFEYAKEYAPLLFILIPLAYLYTIGRYQLLGLNIRIRRNIQYFFIIGLWRLSLIVIFLSVLWIASKQHIILPNLHFNGSSLEVLKHPLAPDLDMIYQKILLAGIALIFFFILRYFDRRFSLFIDSKYYRFKFDFRKLSEKFSELIQDNHSLKDLSKAVVQKLGLFIGLKSSGVMFFKDGNKISAQSYDGVETKELSEFFIAVGAQIIKSVENYTGAMPVEYLPEKLKNVFESCGFKYVFPILNKGNLIGIIITGEKQSETAYHADDMELFTIICNQVSIAAENAFLYEDLAKRERMKHELDLARKNPTCIFTAKYSRVQQLRYFWQIGTCTRSWW